MREPVTSIFSTSSAPSSAAAAKVGAEIAAAAPAPNIIAKRIALATLLLLYMFTPWIT